MNQKELLPGWKEESVLGEGGFGKVYEVVKSDGFGGEYHSALKMLTIPKDLGEYNSYVEDGYDNETITEIFRNQVESITSEFKLMNQLKGHSNIVSCEDLVVQEHKNNQGWDIFIRMELLSTLPEYYKKNGFSEDTAIKIGTDICTALESCQKYEIMHRDIKPSNIFVNEMGNFKLGDFGIARTSSHTTRATKTGTYSYMAPEVYSGKAYNNSIDLYSLGMVLYWYLNERRGPFLPLPPTAPTSSQNEDALFRRMRGDKLPMPKNGSEALKKIVLKACSAKPENRYASPGELKAALLSLQQQGKKNEEISTANSESKISDSEEENTVLISENNTEETCECEQTVAEEFTEDATVTLDINNTNDDQFESAMNKYKRGNVSEAFSDLSALAHQGDGRAQLQLAAMFEKGEGTATDSNWAEFWLKKASSSEEPEVKYGYAITLLSKISEGKLNSKEAKTALKYLDSAAKAEYMPAIEKFIDVCIMGYGTPVQCIQSRKYCKTLIDRASDAFEKGKYKALYNRLITKEKEAQRRHLLSLIPTIISILASVVIILGGTYIFRGFHQDLGETLPVIKNLPNESESITNAVIPLLEKVSLGEIAYSVDIYGLVLLFFGCVVRLAISGITDSKIADVVGVFSVCVCIGLFVWHLLLAWNENNNYFLEEFPYHFLAILVVAVLGCILGILIKGIIVVVQKMFTKKSDIMKQ